MSMLSSLYIVSLNPQINPGDRENHDSSFVEYSLDRLSHWSNVSHWSSGQEEWAPKSVDFQTF